MLKDKKEYVLHYQNLQLYLDQWLENKESPSSARI